MRIRRLITGVTLAALITGLAGVATQDAAAKQRTPTGERTVTMRAKWARDAAKAAASSYIRNRSNDATVKSENLRIKTKRVNRRTIDATVRMSVYVERAMCADGPQEVAPGDLDSCDRLHLYDDVERVTFTVRTQTSARPRSHARVDSWIRGDRRAFAGAPAAYIVDGKFGGRATVKVTPLTTIDRGYDGDALSPDPEDGSTQEPDEYYDSDALPADPEEGSTPQDPDEYAPDVD
jgi:hypothetical protein